MEGLRNGISRSKGLAWVGYYVVIRSIIIKHSIKHNLPTPAKWFTRPLTYQASENQTRCVCFEGGGASH